MAIYLKNADLLREIHRSKLTYCSYVDPADSSPDVYAQDINQLPPVSEMLQAKAKKLGVPVNEVKLEDLVIRIMTYEHIPLVQKGEKMVYQRLPFPPFKHYRFKNGKYVEVLRSHWEGGIQNGSYCINHGRLTNTLGAQINLLVERISRKPQFSGYSYRNDMCSDAMMHLVYVALKFDESKGNNPFAFYTTIATHSFKGFLSGEKRHRNTRDEYMMEHGMNPSYSYVADDSEV